MTAFDFEKKILIVEDDFANQQVASLFLKRFGFQTEIAENGKQAVEMANQQKYPIIFMDCQMPLMDGFEATKKIRNYCQFNQQTPIIALTANLLAGISLKCQQAGMDDILNKPVKMDEMQLMAKKWFDQSSKTD